MRLKGTMGPDHVGPESLGIELVVFRFIPEGVRKE